jgi:hypothetical protein
LADGDIDDDGALDAVFLHLLANGLYYFGKIFNSKFKLWKRFRYNAIFQPKTPFQQKKAFLLKSFFFSKK